MGVHVLCDVLGEGPCSQPWSGHAQEARQEDENVPLVHCVRAARGAWRRGARGMRHAVGGGQGARDRISGLLSGRRRRPEFQTSCRSVRGVPAAHGVQRGRRRRTSQRGQRGAVGSAARSQPNVAEIDKLWPKALHVVVFGPDLVETGTNLVEIGLNLPKFGQIRPDARFWSSFARIWTCSVEIRPKPVKHGRIQPNRVELG